VSYSLKDLNILLIEDDPSMRLLLRDILMAFDVGNVETAIDGSRAYDLLKRYRADLIIVDWLMEPVNGLEFVKRIRNASDSPNAYVPIIMLTAYSDIDRVLECRDAGITEFLAKPFTPLGLYNRLVSVIEDQRSYIRSETYFGPDRRRVNRPFPGPERRADVSVIDIDAHNWHENRAPS
jgi:two-component system chemotaxis response regulator CheY